MAWDTIVGKDQSYLEFKFLTLGDRLTIQCADDLLSCTLEPCMVLLINVTPINSTKKALCHREVNQLKVKQMTADEKFKLRASI